MQHITPTQLQDWIKAAQAQLPDGQLPVVQDVREPWELQTASVKPQGFELVAMPMRSVPARVTELGRSHPIACLCHHGGRSAQVAMFLINNGFEQVVNIHGGIHAWAQTLDTSVPTY